MVTMLDCIRRVAPLTRQIVENAEINTDEMIREIGQDIGRINEIVIVGSGSSNNAAVTAAAFMEKVSGLEVHAYMANVFAAKSVHNPNAIYIFVSQTGTSTLVREMLEKMNALGYHTVAVTEDKDTPIARHGKSHVDMGCGYEEYWFRTIGYCTSVLTLMVIALRIALERGVIGSEEFSGYLAQAVQAAENHPKVVNKAIDWFDRNKEELVKARGFIFYGSGTLYGVALEAALKVLETDEHFLAVGYEAEDGLHGPCLGFTKDDVIIALNDGVNDEWMSHGIVDFGKKELGQAYIFGVNPLDSKDLEFEVQGGDFRALEFAPAIEVLAYLLAGALGRDIKPVGEYVDHVSAQYFETHRG
ncbi:MAG: SIS domain-containing protein [Erysipelotrichaceae bacterium]|nr:SIS domain-containing protein [Erysipelotrichaceae bacterium]